jgi:hypothetical protein
VGVIKKDFGTKSHSTSTEVGLAEGDNVGAAEGLVVVGLKDGAKLVDFTVGEAEQLEESETSMFSLGSPSRRIRTTSSASTPDTMAFDKRSTIKLLQQAVVKVFFVDCTSFKDIDLNGSYILWVKQ